MYYITGDRHGNFQDIAKFCKPTKRNVGTTKKDYMIILGDSGINLHTDFNMKGLKRFLVKLPITFIVLHGNDEERAENLPERHKKVEIDNGDLQGTFYIDGMCPNVLFTKMYGKYTIDNKQCYIIGGGATRDKEFRIANNKKYFPSELLTSDEQQHILYDIQSGALDDVTHILTHTSPYRFTPLEWLPPQIDKSTLDLSQELFLDDVYTKVNNFDKWFVGHWHGEKQLGRIQFLYKSILPFR